LHIDNSIEEEREINIRRKSEREERKVIMHRKKYIEVL